MNSGANPGLRGAYIYTIDCVGLDYKTLNFRVRELLKEFEEKICSSGSPGVSGSKFASDTSIEENLGFSSEVHLKIVLKNVLGQRYIGDGLRQRVRIEIEGVPGNDLGAFMDEALIEVFGNAQDGVGNTMNSGKIIVHGDAGDIVGHSMRGGEIYIKGDIGYRGGIHMKSYLKKIPVIVVGGGVQEISLGSTWQEVLSLFWV